MPKPREGYVRPILRPYEERIAGVFLHAWDQWFRSPGRKTFTYRRVRACCVHELIVKEARKEFGRDRDVRIIEGQETIYLMFKNAVVLRLKKGDSRGLGHNNETQTSLAFISADADIHVLPLGLPDVERVEITYQLNVLEMKIEEVLVIGRDGAVRLWSYGIYPRAAAPVTVLPVKRTTVARPDDVLKIPSRRDDKKDAS